MTSVAAFPDLKVAGSPQREGFRPPIHLGKHNRLLFVTPRYAPFMGGVETHVEQVAKRLAAWGVEVHVLTTDPRGELPQNEQRDGVIVRRVKAWPAQRDYYFAPGIVPIIRGEPWDMVHIQSYHTLVAPLAMLAALQARHPYVVTFHGGGHSSALRNKMRGPQLSLLTPLLRRADCLVALAEFEIEAYSKGLGIPEDRFAFIPNGSDLPQQRPAKDRPGDEIRIASVGRLERYKGHQRILAAFPRILDRYPQARLWIAGSGPYEPELRRMAQELQVADRVEIYAVPAQDRQQFAEELSRASLMVLLSDYETHPIAVLEALSLSVPALVADTSGLGEIARRGWARSVGLDSTPDLIAQAAFAQIQNPIFPAELELPTWDACASSLLLMYQSVLKERVCVS